MAVTGAVLGGVLKLELAALGMTYIRTTLAHDSTSATLLSQFGAILLALRLCIALLVVGKLLLVRLWIRLVKVCSGTLLCWHGTQINLFSVPE